MGTRFANLRLFAPEARHATQRRLVQTLRAGLKERHGYEDAIFGEEVHRELIVDGRSSWIGVHDLSLDRDLARELSAELGALVVGVVYEEGDTLVAWAVHDGHEIAEWVRGAGTDSSRLASQERWNPVLAMLGAEDRPTKWTELDRVKHCKGVDACLDEILRIFRIDYEDISRTANEAIEQLLEDKTGEIEAIVLRFASVESRAPAFREPFSETDFVTLPLGETSTLSFFAVNVGGEARGVEIAITGDAVERVPRIVLVENIVIGSGVGLTPTTTLAARPITHDAQPQILTFTFESAVVPAGIRTRDPARERDLDTFIVRGLLESAHEPRLYVDVDIRALRKQRSKLIVTVLAGGCARTRKVFVVSPKGGARRIVT